MIASIIVAEIRRVEREARALVSGYVATPGACVGHRDGCGCMTCSDARWAALTDAERQAHARRAP